jgi:hypothetical protein
MNPQLKIAATNTLLRLLFIEMLMNGLARVFEICCPHRACDRKIAPALS